MVNGSVERHRHFILEGVTETESYRSPQQGGSSSTIPQRDRIQHGTALQQQVEELRLSTDAAREARLAAGMDEVLGLQVEFESFPDIELAFESLARERSGIELLNVRQGGNLTRATVLVPDGKLDHFANLIADYLTEKRDKIGRARDNRRLINAIRQIRAATLQALWTDDADFPIQENDQFWWEVWIRARPEAQAAVSKFREVAEVQGIQVAQGEVIFPERVVLLVYASVKHMRSSLQLLDYVAELRRAKETADFFDSQPIDEQWEWLDDLLSRTSFASYSDDVPYVCLLDTGVNRGHPLLDPSLATSDVHTVEPAWGTDDADGHGTEMAGLALAGNLTEVLVGSGPVNLGHRLESVKLLSQAGATGTDPHHHGYLTQEATARVEVSAPFRRRVLGMAITARDNRDRGRPSAWSAALDSLAVDVPGQGTNPRLLVVSAGNTDEGGWLDYPESNDTDGIHDPAQAWNALTVGACTNLVHVTEPDVEGFEIIAPGGGLSPSSTTSLTWANNSPLKPDLVLEGGNSAKDSLSAVTTSSLSLLTTNHRPDDRLFTTTGATSAASALASRMAAQIMAEYPELWPETIRALMVHSAEWTDAMKRSYLPAIPTKADYQRLLRRCGFGVPDISRALWSVSNSLTMVVQERLHPFKKEMGKSPANRDMHIHNLPWPREVLDELGGTQVDMRVTLSYFIEPNPSRRGHSRYRYESHGLRFDVKRALETFDEFRGRINAAARIEDEMNTGGDHDQSWLIGKQGRHRGSLHGDVWQGTAADLANRGYIGVYPSMGWWRTRPALHRYNQAARYSLIISIKAPEAEVDLYAEVANRVAVAVSAET